MPHTGPTRPPDTVATHMGDTQSDCELAVVGWFGDVDLTGAPVDPGADPGGGHRQGPVRVGLEPVVTPTQTGQIGQHARPGGKGYDMVEVAEPGHGRTTGETAAQIAFAHSASQMPTRLVGPGTGIEELVKLSV